MAGRAPSTNDFSELLERGAQVDDIFKDSPTPLGSNPYDVNEKDEGAKPAATVHPIAPLLVEESGISFPQAAKGSSPENLDPQVAIIDNDSLFCVNRKFAALEALLKLVTRDYFTFGQLISEILRVAMDAVKSEAGSFLEIDHQNKCMFFRAVTGRSSESLLNFTVPLGQGIAGFVCETQQPMNLSNIDDSSVYLRSISNAVGFETRNLAAYPIVVRGVSFGCLELLNRLGEAQYTDADKEVMAAIADYAGKVIENRLILAAMSKELIALKGKTSGEDAA